MSEMDRFSERRSLAGILQPGDWTRYEMVAVELWDTVEVIVINEGFFDKITFLKSTGEVYKTYRKVWRDEETNPWTVKAAKEMFDKLMEGL